MKYKNIAIKSSNAQKISNAAPKNDNRRQKKAAEGHNYYTRPATIQKQYYQINMHMQYKNVK